MPANLPHMRFSLSLDVFFRKLLITRIERNYREIRKREREGEKGGRDRFEVIFYTIYYLLAFFLPNYSIAAFKEHRAHTSVSASFRSSLDLTEKTNHKKDH